MLSNKFDVGIVYLLKVETMRGKGGGGGGGGDKTPYLNTTINNS